MSDPMAGVETVFIPLHPTDEEVDAVTPPTTYTRTRRQARAERLETCRGCDRLLRATHTCKECGCFMGLKSWIPAATCPLGKWGEAPETQEAGT